MEDSVVVLGVNYVMDVGEIGEEVLRPWGVRDGRTFTKKAVCVPKAHYRKLRVGCVAAAVSDISPASLVVVNALILVGYSKCAGPKNLDNGVSYGSEL
jgi:hypothetical protein